MEIGEGVLAVFAGEVSVVVMADVCEAETDATVLWFHDANPIADGARGMIEDRWDPEGARALEGAEGLSRHRVKDVAWRQGAADPGVEAVILPEEKGAGAGTEGGGDVFERAVNERGA